MIDRLKVIMEKEGLNPSQLADKLHVQRSGLSHILSGRNNPSLDFVKKVLTGFPQYDTEWFMFGDTGVNNGVYKSEQKKELSLFEDDYHSTESSSLKPKKITRLPKEIEKKQVLPSEKTSVKKLVKIIMVYDNHTFEELTAE
jgi:transcriptional regulator with XRE-family HTH domain